jgi:carbonic anhydrase/acetyltransferase-like protein (isoleucine patch superfamily)
MLYAIDDTAPEIDESCFVAPDATIIGHVDLAADASIWPGAVVRADSDTIRIGERSNVQDNAVLHTADGYPTNVGRDVTIGHSAIVHACDVGDETLIGMGAKVLTDAVIGDNCIVAAGAVVPEETEIPDGSVVMGVPGQVVREMTADDIERVRENARIYVEKKDSYRDGLQRLD